MVGVAFSKGICLIALIIKFFLFLSFKENKLVYIVRKEIICDGSSWVFIFLEVCKEVKCFYSFLKLNDLEIRKEAISNSF